jgi:protein TonB
VVFDLKQSSSRQLIEASPRAFLIFSILFHAAVGCTVWVFNYYKVSSKINEIQVSILFEPGASNAGMLSSPSLAPQPIYVKSSTKPALAKPTEYSVEVLPTPTFQTPISPPKAAVKRSRGQKFAKITPAKNAKVIKLEDALISHKLEEKIAQPAASISIAKESHPQKVYASIKNHAQIVRKVTHDTLDLIRYVNIDRALTKEQGVEPSLGGLPVIKTDEAMFGDENPVILSRGYLPKRGFQSAFSISENKPPVYPRVSERLGEEGTVRLLVTVSALGRSSEIIITQTSGHARLDQAAVMAVKDWRFTPASNNGKAVETSIEVPIRFTIQ